VTRKDDLLDRAWSAVEAGDPEGALGLADDLPPDLREVWVLRATALLEVGDLEGARESIARADALGDGTGDDADLDWVHAELDLSDWRIEEARDTFERLAQRERNPAVLGRLSLCWELLGDVPRADALLAEARDLDPEGWPLPARLSDEEFERVLDVAVERLPAPFRELLADTQILVESVPSRELIDPSEPSETPPDLLGLFVGASHLERGEADYPELPPTIHLFQRNLERAAGDLGRLVEEIHTTLYHEIGHVLGFDEDGVAELGLE
jgi:predicted Zn-dependent protease with MMP-like domain